MNAIARAIVIASDNSSWKCSLAFDGDLEKATARARTEYHAILTFHSISIGHFSKRPAG
jgi:hypothetical protein